jgi:hydrogenase maturation protein HypF
VKQVLEAVKARQFNVKGMVQGVGFRPFVYRLARIHDLKGYVLNTSDDVTIVTEGRIDDIEIFYEELRQKAPPQARIESVFVSEQLVRGYHQFEIKPSLSKKNGSQLISPDIATCSACKLEITSYEDRRFHYPFTNCTNCGPRFTIIEDIPYDRSLTTMRKFQMCPQCQQEYDNPENRRFHAQPNACPICGPRLQLTDNKGKTLSTEDVIAKSSQLLKEGNILAIKGLGGFLLACDATSDQAIQRLRERKRRPEKPFATMVKDLDQAGNYCVFSSKEAEILTSPAGPIVLLNLKPGNTLSKQVAPGLKHLGLMLPYTPLHHLLLNETNLPLIMTSGNLSEEPIAKDNEEALLRLSTIADYFILHNRDIYSRYDDSVVMVEQDKPVVLRRARGFAPYPIHLNFSSKPVLACGAELKNTFCLSEENHAFISQHIGDMENEDTLEHFENTLRSYERLFRIQPKIIACDMHPDYLSSQWAEIEAKNKQLPLIQVQHHHAHIVSCMADNGVREPVIGVAFDGTGYGTDGHIWGGEFMIADYQGFQRKAHFEYLPLPGGGTAIVRPYRTAIGYIYSLLGNNAFDLALPLFKDVDPLEIELIKKQIKNNLNVPSTSSCGRLFDAVSSLLGIRQQISYEGQAAIEMEALADDGLRDKLYPYDIEIREGIGIIKLRKMISALISDLIKGTAVPAIAAVFHNTIANIIGEEGLRLSEESGIRQVALSGGVFQNRKLLNQAAHELRKRNLIPLLHSQVPSNDGGVSLGQAVISNFFKGRN